MATETADPMEQQTGSSTATLDRKRPHEVISYDAASDAGPGQSTPRKRSKRAGKIGHQDVRDFVPVGASFSKIALGESQDSDDDDPQAETRLKNMTSDEENPTTEPAELVPTPNELSGIKSLHAVQAAPPVNWNAVNTTKIRTTLGGSVGKVEDLAAETNLANGNVDAEVDSASAQPLPEEAGESLKRQGTSDSDKRVILNLDYGKPEIPPHMRDQSVQPTRKSGSRDYEMRSEFDNLDNQQDPPPIDPIDNDLDAHGIDAAGDSGSESKDSDEDSDGQSEDGDAMKQYSSSVQITANEAGQNSKTIAVPPVQRESQKARILADLSSHDLNAQFRYFYATHKPEEIDRNRPVKCLVCAEEGHMAGICEYLTCSACGAFNQHTTQACPNNAKCGKCREQGHDEGRCPYKLKKMPRHEIVCDLCQRNGHVEQDCELIWRTSGRPWESDLAHARIRLFCYECGHSGHLGNDCPSRRPDKPMGTSTWAAHMGPVSIKSTRELKIKGKATQRYPTIVDDSDDEQANFYRPKISLPEPVRKGHIRIVAGRRESPMYEPSKNDRQVYADNQYDPYKPANDYYANDDARQHHQQYQDGGSGNWREGDGTGYATGRNDARYQTYRANERRSRSPRYRNHEDKPEGGSWLSSRVVPRAEYRDRRPAAPNLYQPMPSAAQNAWIRRRV